MARTYLYHNVPRELMDKQQIIKDSYNCEIVSNCEECIKKREQLEIEWVKENNKNNYYVSEENLRNFKESIGWGC